MKSRKRWRMASVILRVDANVMEKRKMTDMDNQTAMLSVDGSLYRRLGDGSVDCHFQCFNPEARQGTKGQCGMRMK